MKIHKTCKSSAVMGNNFGLKNIANHQTTIWYIQRIKNFLMQNYKKKKVKGIGNNSYKVIYLHPSGVFPLVAKNKYVIHTKLTWQL